MWSRKTFPRPPTPPMLHPAAKAGTAGAIASNKAQGKGDATENISVASYATDAATATGETDRTIRNKTRIGNSLGDVADLLEGTAIESGDIECP